MDYKYIVVNVDLCKIMVADLNFVLKTKYGIAFWFSCLCTLKDNLKLKLSKWNGLLFVTVMLL